MPERTVCADPRSRSQHSTGVRGSRAEGREGIQCKFSTGREGAIEESEVVIWVAGVLLNAASDSAKHISIGALV